MVPPTAFVVVFMPVHKLTKNLFMLFQISVKEIFPLNNLTTTSFNLIKLSFSPTKNDFNPLIALSIFFLIPLGKPSKSPLKSPENILPNENFICFPNFVSPSVEKKFFMRDIIFGRVSIHFPSFSAPFVIKLLIAPVKVENNPAAPFLPVVNFSLNHFFMLSHAGFKAFQALITLVFRVPNAVIKALITLLFFNEFLMFSHNFEKVINSPFKSFAFFPIPKKSLIASATFCIHFRKGPKALSTDSSHLSNILFSSSHLLNEIKHSPIAPPTAMKASINGLAAFKTKTNTFAIKAVPCATILPTAATPPSTAFIAYNLSLKRFVDFSASSVFSVISVYASLTSLETSLYPRISFILAWSSRSYIPSATMPFASCHFLNAASVSGPQIPSAPYFGKS